MIENNINNTPSQDTKEIQNDRPSKCPRCGINNIVLDQSTGHWKCQECLYEFNYVKENTPPVIKSMENKVVDTSNLIALKCPSCHSEIIIDKNYLNQARCHWCRNMLSINNQVNLKTPPNELLPFTVTREEAKFEIMKFIKEKDHFVLPAYKEELVDANIIPVYLPYVLMDVMSHAHLYGTGEHEVNKYYKVEESGVTFYDADAYDIEREYDLFIHGMMVEKNNVDKKTLDKAKKTISAIMPFDVENSIDWSPNYMGACSADNRNIDYEELKNTVLLKAKNETKFAANETLQEYGRGVAWTKEDISINQTKWKITYLPVWLYSYKDKNTIHFVAVNGRTKETAGTIPIYMNKLLLVSTGIEIISLILMILLRGFALNILFLSFGFIFFFIIKYLYNDIKIKDQKDIKSKNTMYNIKQEDKLLQRKTGLRTTRIIGANNLDEIGTNQDVIYDERDRTSQSNKEFTRQK